MQIPEPEITITSLIDAAHQDRIEKPRAHMGCSTLGHHCERWLWLSFRWAVVEKFQGRILRLFRRGFNEEATIISDLRAIGMSVTEPNAGLTLAVTLAGAWTVLVRVYLVRLRLNTFWSLRPTVSSHSTTWKKTAWQRVSPCISRNVRSICTALN